jgi:hypothetical protein
MNCKVLVLIGTLSLIGVPTKTWATEVRLSAKSRYFEVFEWFGDGSLAQCWRGWLQAHRAIKKQPRLAHKLAVHPPRLYGSFWRRDIKALQELGLTTNQIESQPGRLYTLQLAVYERKSGARWFLSRFWKPRRMQRLRVYERTPKHLQLFGGGDVDSKDDPLYAVWAVVQKRKMVCVRYGIYESVTDANQDRKTLEKYLGLQLQVLAC